MAERIIVKADVLKAFAQDIFRKAGLAVKHSQQTAEALVWADMRGHPAHGVSRVPAYVEWIASGQINAKAKPKAALKKGAVVKIAADGAVGPVAMIMAADAAVTQAKEHAVSWVLVQDHAHAGAMGHYAQRVAENGMVAIVMSALRPAMAYHGTKGVAVSNSPMAFAMPGGIMLDMSTAATSRTKLDVAKITGKPLPAGLALDKDGRMAADPAFAETMLPAGGAKGAGLSLMIEAMTSAMLGNPLISSALNEPGLMKDIRQNSLIIAMDASVLGNVEQLKTELAMLALSIKGQPRAEGFDEILLPGERGARAYARRSREGVPVPARTWNQLGDLAQKLGIGVPQKSAA